MFEYRRLVLMWSTMGAVVQYLLWVLVWWEGREGALMNTAQTRFLLSCHRALQSIPLSLLPQLRSLNGIGHF